mmetsp:Transcript_26859/g.54986  ORF Transcript_26859/g.54986 Transcript_26859/m.54986 type:complete len:81 (-) Transcript_26859:199-441(-)
MNSRKFLQSCHNGGPASLDLNRYLPKKARNISIFDPIFLPSIAHSMPECGEPRLPGIISNPRPEGGRETYPFHLLSGEIF